MQRKFFVISILFLGLFAVWFQLPEAVLASHDPVQRSTPPDYEKIRGYLTPAEEVLARKDRAPGKEEKGAILLYEAIQYVYEDGRRLLINHSITQAGSPAGAEELEEDVHSFQRDRHRIHLVEARAFAADGSVAQVRENASFIRTPQREADLRIYNDAAELVLIFPKLGPGTILETIVATEEFRPRMPDEYGTCISFSGGWPIRTMRFLVDLPDGLAQRVKYASLGDLAKPMVTHGPERTVYEWVKKGIANRGREASPEPTSHTGPYLRMSSLRDWDTFASWYWQEVNSMGSPDEAMIQQVKGWLAGVETEEEKTRILFEKAARDVRYIGLTFGESDIRPHSVQEVWDSRYGDCKDKANLLRAWLEIAGIPSRLALVNTDHSGFVDKRIPGYRDFNHMILAVGPPGAELLFCDPTIEYAWPGLISQGDAGRDVLLISEGKAEWARTPDVGAGSVTWRFELERNGDGMVEGWFLVEFSGYWAAWYKASFESRDGPARRVMFQNWARSFYEDADVIDFDVGTLEKQTLKASAYVTLRNTVGDGDNLSFRFPSCAYLLADTGETEKRLTTFLETRESLKVEMRLNLGGTWSPLIIPKPCRESVRGLKAAGNWKVQDATCEATLTLDMPDRLISAQDFTALQQASKRVAAWMNRPLVLQRATSNGTEPAAGAAETPNAVAEKMPTLSSVSALMEWVNLRYPEDGNLKLRRLALEEVKRRFPQDPAGLFEVDVWLSYLEHLEKQDDAALKRVEAALIGAGELWDPESRAWAEYCKAVYLHAKGSMEGALEILERLARNEELSSHRRGWAAVLYANWSGDRDKAIEVARLNWSENSPAFAQLCSVELQLLARRGDRDLFDKRMREISGTNHSDLATVANRLAGAGEAMREEEDIASLEILASGLTSYVSGWSGVENEVLNRITELAVASESQKAKILALERIRNIISGEPFPAWARPGWMELLVSGDALVDAVENAASEDPPDRFLRLAVKGCQTLAPEKINPDWFWKIAFHLAAEGRRREDPKGNESSVQIYDLLEQYPRNSDVWCEAQFSRAGMFECFDKLDEARTIYERFVLDPGLPKTFAISGWGRFARVLECLGDYDRAADCYKRVLGDAATERAVLFLTWGVLMELRRGQWSSALQMIEGLSNVPEKTLSQSPFYDLDEELIRIASDSEAAKVYWKKTSCWWPVWEAISRKMKLVRATVAVRPMNVQQVFLAPSQWENLPDRWESFSQNLPDLVESARWNPGLIEKLVRVLWRGAISYPEYRADLLKLAGAILENSDYRVGAFAQTVQVLQVLNLVQGGRVDEAQRLFVSLPEIGRDDPLRFLAADAVGQISAELGQGEAAASDLIQSLLKEKISGELRSALVATQVKLLANQGFPAEAQRLVNKENKNTENQSAASKKSLAAAQRWLKDSGDSRAVLAIKQWIETAAPPWLRITPPDLGEELVSEMIRGGIDPLQRVRVVSCKRDLVEAAKAKTDEEQRARLFAQGVVRAASFSQDQARAAHVIGRVLDDRRLGERIQMEVLYELMAYGAEEGWPLLWKRLENSMMVANRVKGIDPRYRDFEQLRTLVSIPMDDVKAFEVYSYKMEKDAGAHPLLLAAERCLRAGRLDRAEELLNASRKAMDGKWYEAMRAQIARELELAKSNYGAQEALRKAAMEWCGDSAIERPGAIDRLMRPDAVDFLSQEDAAKVLHWRLERGLVFGESFTFWCDFLRLWRKRSGGVKQMVRALTEAEQHIKNDASALSFISLLNGCLDWDHPEDFAEASRLATRFRNASAFPRASKQWSFLETKAAFRNRILENPPEALRPFLVGKNANQAVRLILIWILQHEDKEMARSFLLEISLAQLMEPENLPLTVAAAKLADMQQVRMELTDSAPRLIRTWVADAMATGSRPATKLALLLDKEVGGTKMIPAGFEEAAVAATENEAAKHWIRLLCAEHRGDWKEAESLAEALLQLDSTFYGTNWHLARARWEQGERQEAIAPLEIFVKYNGDSADLLRAEAMLREARSNP